MSTRKLNHGQSLIEVVFAIGLILIVIAGVVTLLLMTIGSRTKSYNRQKAVELSQIIMENMVKESINTPESFWNTSSEFWNINGSPQTNGNYPDYSYTVTNDPVLNATCTANKCMNVEVLVTWQGSEDKVKSNRFFSRN